MQGEMKTYRGACHCQKVQFEIQSTLEPSSRCNCSLCRRRGAVMTRVPEDRFRLLSGEEFLSPYQFNTRVAKHYFCKHCGIYPFHQTRRDPARWRVNLGCLEGVDVYALEASVADGASLSVVEDA